MNYSSFYESYKIIKLINLKLYLFFLLLLLLLLLFFNICVNLQIFNNFFNGWLIRQENYLHKLLQFINATELEQQNDPRLTELIARVMAHYSEYYEAKSRIAHVDVFLVFSPVWLSSFERNFLWVAGFKQGLAFRLVKNSVMDLTGDQARRLERLTEETRAEEEELAEELARIQEQVAAAPMLAVARRMGRGEDDEAAVRGEMEAAVEKIGSEMEDLVGCGDMLRSRTVVKVIEILNLGEKVRFLVAVAQFQRRIRNWGLQNDAAAAEGRNA